MLNLWHILIYWPILRLLNFSQMLGFAVGSLSTFKKKSTEVFYFVFLELSNFILKRTYAKIMPKTAIL